MLSVYSRIKVWIRSRVPTSNIPFPGLTDWWLLVIEKSSDWARFQIADLIFTIGERDPALTTWTAGYRFLVVQASLRCTSCCERILLEPLMPSRERFVIVLKMLETQSWEHKSGYPRASSKIWIFGFLDYRSNLRIFESQHLCISYSLIRSLRVFSLLSFPKIPRCKSKSWAWDTIYRYNLAGEDIIPANEEIEPTVNCCFQANSEWKDKQQIWELESQGTMAKEEEIVCNRWKGLADRHSLFFGILSRYGRALSKIPIILGCLHIHITYPHGPARASRFLNLPDLWSSQLLNKYSSDFSILDFSNLWISENPIMPHTYISYKTNIER